MVKSVRLSDTVYNSLKAVKEEGESYSDLVIRLTSAEKKEPIEVFRALATEATKRFEVLGIGGEDIAREIKLLRKKRRENKKSNRR